MFALKGTLITPSEILKDGVVIIEGSRIKAVCRPEAPDAALLSKISKKDFLDAGKGMFICPGFIDLHVQGAGGCDILDGNLSAVNTIARTLAKNGVTAFLATTVVQPQNLSHLHLSAVGQAMKKGTAGAQALGAHLEGPFISPFKCGMITKANITGFTRRKLDEIIDTSRGSLKMMTVAPELPGAVDVIKRLRKNKIVASMGHTDATYEEAERGIDAGITHATHIFNAMRSLHQRQPGAVGAVLADDRVSAQLIADGRHLHPAVVKLVIRQKAPQGVALITDSVSAAGLPDGRYVYNGLNYDSKDGLAVYCGAGTFIGTTLTLNKIIKRVVDMAAASLRQAVEMASLTPAAVLGIQDKKGSLEAGKDADIAVMDKDCNVKMTIVGGRIVK